MSFLKSSITKKALMAASGFMLVGFIVAHLAGNLTIFFGQGALNAYAAKLHHLGGLLWVARFILLGAVGLHIATAILLTQENRRARPVPYRGKGSSETTYAARTMAVSGIIVLSYIVYHLMHFTFRVTHPETYHLKDALGRDDVFSMVVLSFQNLPTSAVYIISIFLLCAHLSHGFSSMFQSLGLNDAKRIPLLKKAGLAFAALIFIGYASIPFAVLTGLIKAPGVSI